MQQTNRDNTKAAPLISVIVPIYNVEKYIRKCLDSLKNQTLSEIEVICIDDGSTDRSGKIADEYKNEDGWPIFRVIHTENNGLSVARNRGIDESKADWLMFVDSDDWVSEDFCKIPYEVALENQADLVIFRFYCTYENEEIKKQKSIHGFNGVIDYETAVDSGTGVWNKLYSKSLFDSIRYPEGHVYEDVFTTHKLFFKANRIFQREDRLYYYRRRKGSITKSNTSRRDEYLAKRQQYYDLIEFGYPKEKAELRLQAASLAYCGHAANTDEHLYCFAQGIVDTISEIPESFNKRQRKMLLVWKVNRKIYRTIYYILGKQMKHV